MFNVETARHVQPVESTAYRGRPKTGHVQFFPSSFRTGLITLATSQETRRPPLSQKLHSLISIKTKIYEFLSSVESLRPAQKCHATLLGTICNMFVTKTICTYHIHSLISQLI